ncbi:MAG: FAD binding domain-containing protein, partial [Amylibacter sp.]
MYETKYHKASSVDEAVSLMGAADDGKLLSGGQTLLPTMKAHLAAPSDLVDVSGIAEINGVSVRDNVISIGA